ncbi:immunity 26/phosphotriesterase HocA family protein [Mucilaginibacter sp. BJC16-A38]|uniref:immunity 26/phosphotriesterase HocA family protein n=1 Tax=Mucilaginibacter phenanthrenivorans TaxID=1234842 RepID=UPI0021581EAD|nr:immunity 26/phosphotriesterase HocA family protein [Mucilaginibacter phenanthrenivorans]MCR8561398.1 immunity 26/phosphotriesterase HocA family protein [Mucilaginibacter phenanthrenivorans]
MAIRKVGAFFEIILSNGKYAYGRILEKANYAFYDIYSNTRISDIKEIQNKDILFIAAVYKYAITKDRWRKIGQLDLESKLRVLPLKFIEDQLYPGTFSLYDPNTGVISPTTKDKCLGLERAAVWEPTHIEDRIIDYYEGKPNKWVNQLELK